MVTMALYGIGQSVEAEVLLYMYIYVNLVYTIYPSSINYFSWLREL